MMIRTIQWLLISAALVVACQTGPAGSVGVDPTLDPAVARAIDFRSRVGLRSDEGWVREVATQSVASHSYGVPLMPFERAELDARAATAKEIRPVIEAYGNAHLDEYGGTFIDHGGSGAIVALFRGTLSEHEGALAQSIRPGALFEVREARWSLRELNDLQARILSDKSWLQTAGAELVSVGVPVARNLVELRIRADGRDFASAVINHFEAQGMLDVQIEGLPLGSVPKGALRGIVVDKTGAPVAGADVEAISAQPGVVFHNGDVAILTRDDGSFFIPELPAVEYEISIKRLVREDEFKLLAQAKTTVVAGGVTSIRIIVTN